VTAAAIAALIGQMPDFTRAEAVAYWEKGKVVQLPQALFPVSRPLWSLRKEAHASCVE
jgi:hypothetical protein